MASRQVSTASSIEDKIEWLNANTKWMILSPSQSMSTSEKTGWQVSLLNVAWRTVLTVCDKTLDAALNMAVEWLQRNPNIDAMEQFALDDKVRGTKMNVGKKGIIDPDAKTIKLKKQPAKKLVLKKGR